MSEFNAVTEHTNLECEVDGVKLTGFLLDDGARYWLWARDESDARMVVAEMATSQGEDPREAYERQAGQSIDDAWVTPLTVEVMAGVTFQDDDGNGTKRPMVDEMRARQGRGIVASSEW